jgi:hypothetical protein
MGKKVVTGTGKMFGSIAEKMKLNWLGNKVSKMA